MKRKQPLQRSILYSWLITIVGILAVLFPLTYTIAANLLQRNAISYKEQLLQQVNNSVDYYVDGMLRVSDYIAADPNIVTYLLSSDAALRPQVSQTLKTISGTRPDFVNVILFREDGSFVANRDQVSLNPYWNYRQQEWYVKAIEAEGTPVLSSSRVENIVEGQYNWVVSVSRAIYSHGKVKGVLLIDLNYRQIADICSSLSDDKESGYIFIVGADNHLVYHPQQRLIYSGVKAERFDLISSTSSIQSQIDQGYIYTSVSSPKTGWTMVSVLDTNQLVNISVEIIIFYGLVGLAFSILAFIISYVVSKRLTEPLLVLKQSMKQFEEGDFDAKADLTIHNEVAELGESFNTMTERIKALVEQERLIEEQKRLSDLQTLQAQIRPHFLYNTLESIIWMAETGENDKVIEMTSSLSKLFRASTQNAGELVNLKTESDYVENYMKIQKLRYQDRLNFDMQIDSELYPAKVLRLIVQPLIENAIYHGIKKIKDPGWVLLFAQQEDNKLMIHVCDNGIGFNRPYEISGMGAPLQEGKNIGLSNVHNRIQLFFGTEFGVVIQPPEVVRELTCGVSYAEMRTVVTLVLPLIFE